MSGYQTRQSKKNYETSTGLKMKQKKIGITYFLNHRLKPHRDSEENRYPVYARIVFNRTSTIIPFPMYSYLFGMTEEEYKDAFGKRLDKDVNEQIAYFEREVNQIVRFEYSVLGEKYRVAGLADKLSSYQQPISTHIGRFIKAEFREFIHPKILEKQLDRICHDAMAFEDCFYIAQDLLIPELKSILPLSLKNKIIAYSEFKAFEIQLDIPADSFPFDRQPPNLFDWASGFTQLKFKKFLMYPRDKSSLSPNEPPNSPIFQLHNDFYCTPALVATCLESIDWMIANA
jgi:hypothetical protein